MYRHRSTKNFVRSFRSGLPINVPPPRLPLENNSSPVIVVHDRCPPFSLNSDTRRSGRGNPLTSRDRDYATRARTRSVKICATKSTSTAAGVFQLEPVFLHGWSPPWLVLSQRLVDTFNRGFLRRFQSRSLGPRDEYYTWTITVSRTGLTLHGW